MMFNYTFFTRAHAHPGWISVRSGVNRVVDFLHHVIAYSLRRVNRDLGERQVPMMGVLAAAIFAGQMLNFAVAGGTSGHLMGAALATILLGPWAAILVLTTVVGVQALIFQDGGLLALGANIFNMGVVGVAVSYFVYQTVQRLAGGRRWGIFVRWFSGRLGIDFYRSAGGRLWSLRSPAPPRRTSPSPRWVGSTP